MSGEGAPLRLKIDSLQLASASFADPHRRCRELLEAMRATLAELAPSPAEPLVLHLWLAEVSTARTIRFEARGWIVSAAGRHLRHVARALASTADSSRSDRDRDQIAPRVARSAVNRVLRELSSAVRSAGRDQV